jgi:sugar phosphate isomerase/epimerase
VQTDNLTPERIGLNESTFREANERIEAVADNMALQGLVPFICECPQRACTEIVRLPLDEYEAIRQHPRRFFSAPGHQQIAVDAGAAVVVVQTPGYVIADKVGEAAKVADAQFETLPEATDG